MPKLFKILSISPKLLNVDYSISINKDKEDVNKCIEIFIKVMRSQSKNYNLDNFYNNLEGLSFCFKKFINDSKSISNTSGEYHSGNNMISIEYDFNPKNLFHELFHVSSTVKDKNSVFCGFKQYKKVYDFGKGLNEGYTELLTERYFNSDSSLISYPYEVNIVKHLENFVGKDEMEQYYSNADLYSLVLKLNEYMTEKEIGNFISNLDYINDKIYDKTNLFTDKILTKSLQKSYKFIIDCNIRKLREKMNNNLISYKEARDKIYFIITSIEKIYPDTEIFASEISFYVERELCNINCKSSIKIKTLNM